MWIIFRLKRSWLNLAGRFNSGQTHDKLHFLPTIGPSIGPEDIMKPDLGFRTVGYGSVPGIYRIRLTADQSPVDSYYIFFFQQGHDIEECAVAQPGHIFSTHQGPSIFSQAVDHLPVRLFILIVMITYNVRRFQLKTIKVLKFRIPKPGGQRLGRINFP